MWGYNAKRTIAKITEIELYIISDSKNHVE
jgi:hypothetical protein